MEAMLKTVESLVESDPNSTFQICHVGINAMPV